MRQIGKIESATHAQRFVDYLLTLGISGKFETDSDAAHGIWIHDEGDVPQSRTELEAFRSNPEESRYVEAGREAAEIRKMERLKHEERRKNIHNMREKFSSPLSGNAPITKGIVVICAIVTAIGLFGGQKEGQLGRQVYDAMMFVAPTDIMAYANTGDPLVSIMRGQVWRVLTPVFPHSTSMVLHVFFNMYMLYVLGAPMEIRIGWKKYLLYSLIFAIAGNLGQAYGATLFDGGAGIRFVGYSGALYGIFGYMWMKTWYDPSFGIRLPQSTIFILVGWFFLCWIGMMGNIANYAHTLGLVAGMLVALATLGKD
ncbi:MAG: rhomboid family intramembrane serine protease [Pirellulaceae bacterium]